MYVTGVVFSRSATGMYMCVDTQRQRRMSEREGRDEDI